MKPKMKFVLTYNMFIRAHVLEKTAGSKVEKTIKSPCLLYKNLFEGHRQRIIPLPLPLHEFLM
jgi:hypothetical protein